VNNEFETVLGRSGLEIILGTIVAFVWMDRKITKNLSG
jgi:hypothetical protein